MRDMTIEMAEGVSQPIFRPVVLGYLDILGDPISMWTGAGYFQPTGSDDEILNGKTFFSAQAFVEISDIKEDQGIGGPVSIVLKANDIDEDSLRQFVRDKRKWRGRNAYLWMGLFNETMNGVLPYPIRIKTGIMTRVLVNRTSSEVLLELTVDVDLQNAKASPFRWVDQSRVYEADKFASFVASLGNKPGGLERPSVAAPALSKSTGIYGDNYNREQDW